MTVIPELIFFYSCTCIQWQWFNACCLMLFPVCLVITLLVMSVYTSDVGLLLYVSHQCYQIWRRHLALILRCVQVNSITVMLHRLSLLQTLQWTGWVRYSSESWLPDVDWCFQSCLLEFCCSAVRFWLCWVAGLSALADTALVGMVASSYLSSTGQRLQFYGTCGSGRRTVSSTL